MQSPEEVSPGGRFLAEKNENGVGEWEWRLENSKEVSKCCSPVIKASLMSTKRSKDLGFSI